SFAMIPARSVQTRLNFLFCFCRERNTGVIELKPRCKHPNIIVITQAAGFFLLVWAKSLPLFPIALLSWGALFIVRPARFLADRVELAPNSVRCAFQEYAIKAAVRNRIEQRDHHFAGILPMRYFRPVDELGSHAADRLTVFSGVLDHSPSMLVTQ